MDLTYLSAHSQAEIATVLARTLGHITQTHINPPGKRSLTARAYASAFAAYMVWAKANEEGLPTRSALERWRQMMSRDGLAVSTINKRLSAMRKLLLGAADEIVNLEIKTLLRDWANVENAKAIIQQDKTEEDYGRRLTQREVRELFAVIGTDTLRALRDRAIIAIGVGAGLRVSEIVALTVRDVFWTRSEELNGIRIRQGKHHKSRIVVVGTLESWIFQAVQQYCDAIGLDTRKPSDEYVIRGVHIGTGSTYKSLGTSLSVRQAQAAINAYEIVLNGHLTTINAHDLRRTYAKLCIDNGMAWEALRDNLGHANLKQTQDYVGHTTTWSKRVPQWSI